MRAHVLCARSCINVSECVGDFLNQFAITSVWRHKQFSTVFNDCQYQSSKAYPSFRVIIKPIHCLHECIWSKVTIFTQLLWKLRNNIDLSISRHDNALFSVTIIQFRQCQCFNSSQHKLIYYRIKFEGLAAKRSSQYLWFHAAELWENITIKKWERIFCHSLGFPVSSSVGTVGPFLYEPVIGHHQESSDLIGW